MTRRLRSQVPAPAEDRLVSSRFSAPPPGKSGSRRRASPDGELPAELNPEFRSGVRHADDPAGSLGSALTFMRYVGALNHALERLSSTMDRTLGVTAQQRLILRCVGKHPGISAGQLAQVLHLDPGTVSASLGRLVRRRLVKREHDVRDKRRVVLGLTIRGKALNRPMAGTVEHAVQRLLRATSAPDIAVAAAVLTTFAALLASESEKARGKARAEARSKLRRASARETRFATP